MAITTRKVRQYTVNLRHDGHATLTPWANGEGYDITIAYVFAHGSAPRETVLSLCDDEIDALMLLLAHERASHVVADDA